VGDSILTTAPLLPALIERFFTLRLVHRRNVSAHTIASYRETFRLLFQFARATLHKAPSNLDLADIDPPLSSSYSSTISRRTAQPKVDRDLGLLPVD
jgi:integrase/recombinase XerD